jgi:hypothetical protein
VEAVSDWLLAGRLALAVFDRPRLDESPTTGESASRLQAPVASRGVFYRSLFSGILNLSSGWTGSFVFPPRQFLLLADCVLSDKESWWSCTPKASPLTPKAHCCVKGSYCVSCNVHSAPPLLITGSRPLQPAITARARCRACF